MRDLQLQGDLRQAIENYFGGAMMDGPWDAVIETVAEIIANGELSLHTASALDHALRRTANTEGDECPTCKCQELSTRHKSLAW